MAAEPGPPAAAVGADPFLCEGCGCHAAADGWRAASGDLFCVACWDRWHAQWGLPPSSVAEVHADIPEATPGPPEAPRTELSFKGGQVVPLPRSSKSGASSFCTSSYKKRRRCFRGCCDVVRPASATDWTPTSVLVPAVPDLTFTDLGGEEDPGVYCDAHCHLDASLILESMGDSMWSFKKWLCKHWLAGHCWLGDDCDYAHGEDELLKRPPMREEDVEAYLTSAGDCFPDRSESSPSMSQATRSGRPLLGFLVHNCCEEEAIADSVFLAKVSDKLRLLGGQIFVTFGSHPHEYEEYSDALENKLLQGLKDAGPRAVGWGECGLDYFKNFYDLDRPGKKAEMVDVFLRQARLAASMDLPLVVHSRDAEEDTLRVFKEALPVDHPIHVHAFQGSVPFVREVLRTFPNAVFGLGEAVGWGPGPIADIAQNCPLGRLVLETDAPYISENHSVIPGMASAVARLKGVSRKAVFDATTATCERLYRLRGRAPGALAAAGEH